MKFDQRLLDKVQTLPHHPGVYQYLDQSGQIIYVGKAIDLKKRVSSYFQKEHLDGKTRTLVKLIADIRFTVVQNELEALLLENNLIKSYRPRYNVLLKDDKTYPWIVIKNEPFPRIFPTRKKFNDGSTYYGPYPNVKQMHQLLGLVRELFQIRTCALDLRTQKREQNKYKVCLEYHIGKCAGPCEQLQTEIAYNETIQKVRLLLEGKNYSLIQRLKKEMQHFAANEAFEAAQNCKELIETLGKYQAKSMVVSDHRQSYDVCYVEKNQDEAWMSYLVVSEGNIVHAYSSKVSDPLDVGVEVLYAQLIPQLQAHFESQAKEIIAEEAKRCGMPFVDQRWLGGMLTNFKTVKTSIKRLKDMKAQQEVGLDSLSKKEQLMFKREIEKLEKDIGGIQDMAALPDAIFVIDVGYHKIAISEAKKLGIPLIGVVDSNHSPEGIDYIIPGNDDSAKAVALYARGIADAIIEGRANAVNDVVKAVTEGADEFVEEANASA